MVAAKPTKVHQKYRTAVPWHAIVLTTSTPVILLLQSWARKKRCIPYTPYHNLSFAFSIYLPTAFMNCSQYREASVYEIVADS